MIYVLYTFTLSNWTNLAVDSRNINISTPWAYCLFSLAVVLLPPSRQAFGVFKTKTRFMTLRGFITCLIMRIIWGLMLDPLLSSKIKIFQSQPGCNGMQFSCSSRNEFVLWKYIHTYYRLLTRHLCDAYSGKWTSVSNRDLWKCLWHECHCQSSGWCGDIKSALPIFEIFCVNLNNFLRFDLESPPTDSYADGDKHPSSNAHVRLCKNWKSTFKVC